MIRLALRVSLVLASVASLATAATLSPEAESGNSRQWTFKVYLDDSEIGYHNFLLVEEDGRSRVVTEAEFQVRFLFFTAYSYEHVNRETWQGDCLEEIRSSTDANGKQLSVHGYRVGGSFAVEAPGGLSEVPGCVKSFAYWDPAILDEPALLNSQTGEILAIEVEPVGVETLTVMGREEEAERYRLQAKNMVLELWYSKDMRWLALESTVKGGRKLRYELTRGYL